MPYQNTTIDDGFGNSGGGGGGNPQPTASWILINQSQSVNWNESDGDPSFTVFQMKFNTMTNNYAFYPSYKIKYFINKDYINLSGDTVNSTTKEISITGSGETKSFFPEFIAGNTIPGGTHSIYITMRLFGVGANNNDVFLDERTHSITLNYSQQLSLVKINKKSYNLAFVKSSGLLYGDKDIVINQNASSKICNVVLSQNKEYLSTTPATSTTGFSVIEGVDVQDLENFPNLYAISAKVFYATNLVESLIFNINILENENIVATPALFDFQLVKSNSDTKSATLQLINIANEAYTIALPSWLTASITSGNTSADITLTTSNGSTLLAGTYNDMIVISYGPKTLEIPVSLNVIEYITSEFLSDAYNFCLDGNLIKFYRQSPEGVFVKIILNAVFRINGFSRAARIPLQGVYFQDKCDFDIGDVINNYFLKYRKNIIAECEMGNFIAKSIYSPAEVTIEAQELNSSYNVLTSQSIADVMLYAGKKPTGFPFLTNNLIRSRVEGSKQIVSYIAGLVDPEDIADNISMASALPPRSVASVMICEDNMLVFWPKIKTFSKDGTDLKVYTRNSGNTVVNIQFENQNLAPEYLSFSGDFSFYADKVHTIDNSLKDSESAKFRTESTMKLTLDTGFILKSEIPVINELVDALYCILEIDGKYYQGFCNSSKINGINSTEELVNYPLEFIVQPYEN